MRTQRPVPVHSCATVYNYIVTSAPPQRLNIAEGPNLAGRDDAELWTAPGGIPAEAWKYYRVYDGTSSTATIWRCACPLFASCSSPLTLCTAPQGYQSAAPQTQSQWAPPAQTQTPVQQQQQWGQPQQQAGAYNPGVYGAMPGGYSQVPSSWLLEPLNVR